MLNGPGVEDSLLKYIEPWVLTFCGYKFFKNLIEAMDLILGKQDETITFKITQTVSECM